VLFSVKIDFDLNLGFFVRFVEFFHQFVDKHAVHVQIKTVSLNLFVQVKDEVQNVL